MPSPVINVRNMSPRIGATYHRLLPRATGQYFLVNFSVWPGLAPGLPDVSDARGREKSRHSPETIPKR
jgi:hypothetical protein